ncbi:L,D-transpeptidase family protein [Candidatus Kaiserbacteria bacterium]|nr:L,D-transpeptidase family protein [Candidatus Kaiserbacteria bacterium]
MFDSKERDSEAGISYDSHGLRFITKFTAGFLVLVSIAHFGTAFGSEMVIAAALNPEIANLELQIEEIKAKRTMRSVGEVQLLQELNEYERKLATRTIGTASIETLKMAHERLIGADLSAMKLYLFEHGEAVAEYDILSKGKRGSRWETPTGLYKIQSKEDDHFSSIGEVHMPHSMQFFGNFFIHGWPYYPNGTPVSEGYSGGCIRLSNEDATAIFDFAANGTPIFVWNSSFDSTQDKSSTLTAGGSLDPARDEQVINLSGVPLPKISARAFLIADVHSGQVFAERDTDGPRAIASLSKLLTALVANETIQYDRTLAITAEDRRQTEGTPGSIAANDSFAVGNLLYPLLMESNNSVAYALSRYYGADNFLRWMNDKAQAIGMKNTSLEDPSGISPHNTSTANDLFLLTRYIHDNQSYILNISREKTKEIRAESGRNYTLNNFNVFAGKEGFLGGKTGYTDEARETMVTIFEVLTHNETATVAIIVLGSEDRKADVERLLSWFKKAARAT